jgi:hypothetical protein
MIFWVYSQSMNISEFFHIECFQADFINSQLPSSSRPKRKLEQLKGSQIIVCRERYSYYPLICEV